MPRSIQNARNHAFLILLHVESPQQHDRFFSEKPTVDGIWWIDTRIGVDLHDTATAAKAIIQTAKVDGADTVLTESGGTHDTRLHGHVDVCFLEDALGMLGHDLC